MKFGAHPLRGFLQRTWNQHAFGSFISTKLHKNNLKSYIILFGPSSKFGMETKNRALEGFGITLTWSWLNTHHFVHLDIKHRKWLHVCSSKSCEELTNFYLELILMVLVLYMWCIKKFGHIFKIQTIWLLHFYGRVCRYTSDISKFHEICESLAITPSVSKQKLRLDIKCVTK